MRVVTLADKVTIPNAFPDPGVQAVELLGIDIDEASTRVELEKLVLSRLPSAVETAAA